MPCANNNPQLQEDHFIEIQRSQRIFNKLFLSTNTTNTTSHITSFSFQHLSLFIFLFLNSPSITNAHNTNNSRHHLTTPQNFAKRTHNGNPQPHLMSWFKTKHFNPKTSKNVNTTLTNDLV
jgi:hypothetical protein